MSHPTQHATNALAHASSSYLRTAMHQPIQWNEWGEEAFAKSKSENKPILLDIGAVWCHWCHVMDRESYENDEVAQLINENFVPIKVDRDERPDVDSRYQAAVQAISGQGGWPLTAFLTPDGRPFFGGTYFPPEDHFGRPGFKRVLTSIANAYREKHDDVLESAEAVMSAVSHQESFTGRAGQINPELPANVVHTATRQFDARNGGFGNAPKFPHPAAIDLVIDAYAQNKSDELHNIFLVTLRKMAHGGVYDQLAGGFHRYSVDERWVVPHFEKMSYDNSELLKNYVHAWQATGDDFYAGVAKDIIRWVDEWLSDPAHGGFYASQDADYSLDDDGDYFTWTRDEARNILSGDEFAVASAYYDIGEIGEMHHNHEKNVLWVATTPSEIADRLRKPEPEVRSLLAAAQKKMYAERLKRPTPYVDKTMYVNWNAMMVSAYLTASRVFDLDDARHFALKSLDRILAEGWNGEAKRLQHVIRYSDPAAQKRALGGHLDDYGFTCLACLDAYEATGDMTYFRFAHAIADAMLARFYDPAEGGFFDMDASTDPAALIGALSARRKPLQDAPTPAGDPIAAIAMVRMHQYTNDPKYREAAEKTLACFAGVADHFGIYAGTYAIAVRLLNEPHTQVVIIGDDALAREMAQLAKRDFRLTSSTLHLGEGQAVVQNLPPALAETLPNLPGIQKQRAMAVVCSTFSCQAPICSPQELERALNR
ncbi:MAG TPA: thioredoxin domain-containing protein [Terriglobales bacterium]|nr:thioredoxin domain-containing protein [Terriglobales bacterium]